MMKSSFLSTVHRSPFTVNKRLMANGKWPMVNEPTKGGI